MVTWAEITIHTTNEALDAITNMLYELGASGVVVEDSSDLIKSSYGNYGERYDLDLTQYPTEGILIKVYYPETNLLENKIKKIKRFIHQLKEYDIDIGKNELTINRVKEEDWETSWKKYYKPVNISKQITIVPTWHEYKPQTTNEKLIYLDPGMAFGTGTHPTTKLSIKALEKYIQNSDEVIDVGCGSGILSIASCLLGAKKVFAFDIDEVAVKSTQLNSQINGVNEQINISQNNLLQDIDRNADLIVANILAEIIVDLIDDAWKSLKKGGHFITSGIIQKKKDLVRNALIKKGFAIVEIEEMDDWVCIIAQKDSMDSK